MESQSSSPSKTDAKLPRFREDHSGSSLAGQTHGLSQSQDLPPSPARFLHQPKPAASRNEDPSVFGATPVGSIADHLTPFSHSTGIDTDSQIESTLRGGSDLHPIGLHFREGSGNARKAKKLVRAGELNEEELLLVPYSRSQSTSSGQKAIGDSQGHVPVSAHTVFSRNAAPLSLPELDKYISALAPPPFSHSRDTKKAMFPPLDRLAATGRSIESLEANFKAIPTWRNCNSILHGLVSLVLGLTVSNHHMAISTLKIAL